MKRLSLAMTAVLLVVCGCKKDPPPAPGGTTPAPGTAGTAGTEGTPVAKAGPAGKAPEGCNSDFAQEIAADFTLTEKCSPYKLPGELNVQWTLTIEPGVEVQAADNAAISVGYNKRGRIIARGTTEKPVRFTAQRKEPGAWKGIAVYDQGEGSVLEHVVVEHAGMDDRAAITSEAPLTLKAIKVLGAKRKALSVRAKKKSPELSGLDFSGAGGGEDLVDCDVSQLPAFSEVKFPPRAYLEFAGNSEGDLKIPSLGVPLRLVGDWEIGGEAGNKGGTVTIAAGTRIEVGENAIIWVGYNTDRPAALKAVGTAEQPITFTRFGDDAKSTPWRGINFGEGGRASELDYVKLEYAGVKDTHGMLNFHNARALGKVTHCTFSHGLLGLWVRDGREGFTAFDENTFTDVAQGALRLPIAFAKGIGTKNKFPADSYLLVDGESLNEDSTLAAQTVPWRKLGSLTVEGSEEGKSATLTLDPGATLQFGEGATLFVGYGRSGKLVAKGTADKPVTFKAVEAGWAGINANDKGTLQLENAVVGGIVDDNFGINTVAATQGSVKNVSFKGVKKAGLKRCTGDKLEVSGNKADKGKPELKEDC